MAMPRLGLWVGAGLLLSATSAFPQGGELSPSGANGGAALQAGAKPSVVAQNGAGVLSAPAGAAGQVVEAQAQPDIRATPDGAQVPPPAEAPDQTPVQAAGDTASPAVLKLPFVTLDQARLFGQSRYGARLTAELGERQAELAAENRRIEAELAQKEKTLTEQRARLTGAEFRRLADEFNAEVERYRAEQAAKEREIYQVHERNRALFQDLANQAMAGLLRERGAFAIIAEEAIVLGFRELDITDDAILRLDMLVGDGSSLPQPALPGGNQAPDQTSD